MSTFETLNKINVNGHTEQKNGLTYLSWAWAWAEVKKAYPDAKYEVVKQANGLPYVYDPLTGFMVYTTVTIGDITHEMWLPVMDGANKAMKDEPYTYYVKDQAFRYCHKDDDGKYRDKYGKEHKEYVEKVVEPATMFDVNKTIMRCLVKNLAMFGLGLYIYAGEDLPEDSKEEQKQDTSNNGYPPRDEMISELLRTYGPDQLKTCWKVADVTDAKDAQVMALYGRMKAQTK